MQATSAFQKVLETSRMPGCVLIRGKKEEIQYMEKNRN